MKFAERVLGDACVIELDELRDERGFFARAWCTRDFASQGLIASFVQANVAFNHLKGTLRGMHYQVAPDEEAKLVPIVRGALYDVILDLRAESPTLGQWFGVELTSENRRTLYVPPGFAHGYQTLVDNTEAFYLVSQFHAPRSERGVRWNDPAFGIDWPCQPSVISTKDRNWPDFVLPPKSMRV